MIEQHYISIQMREWEGRKLKAYIPCYVQPSAQARIGKATRNYTGDNGEPKDYRVMGSSGVTIGTGCDLGQQTAKGLHDMGIPDALLKRLSPYIGLSCDDAIRALHAEPFSITDAECDTLDCAVHGEYVRRIAALYDRESAVLFADIPHEAQAVITHLFYHKGSPRTYPATWRAFVRQDWQTAADKLRNGTLWRRSLLSPRAGRCGLAAPPLVDVLFGGVVLCACVAGLMIAGFRLFL